jgi:hypothetical protein
MNKYLDRYYLYWTKTTSVILGPIVNPLSKRIGQPKTWKTKTVGKWFIASITLSKISLWSILIFGSFTRQSAIYWLWLPAMIGLNMVLFLGLANWFEVVRLRKIMTLSGLDSIPELQEIDI